MEPSISKELERICLEQISKRIEVLEKLIQLRQLGLYQEFRISSALKIFSYMKEIKSIKRKLMKKFLKVVKRKRRKVKKRLNFTLTTSTPSPKLANLQRKIFRVFSTSRTQIKPLPRQLSL
jgi:hypothetical protein